MNNTLFSGIIQSKLKIKLLRFFMNPDTRAYLRQLSDEFNVSSNAVRYELNHLSGSDLITAEKQGRKIWLPDPICGICHNQRRICNRQGEAMRSKVNG